MRVPQRILLGAAVATAALAGAGGALLLTGDEDGRRVGAGPTTAPAPSTSPSPTPSPSPSPSPSPVASPTPPPLPALTAADLRRAPVPALCGFPAGRLVDGRLPGTTVALRRTAVGDLDGDGAPEGAALLSCSPEGGGAVELTVHVYAAGTRYLDQVDVGVGLERAVVVEEVRTSAGELEVSGAYPGPDDARCCPSGLVVRRFDLRDGRTRLVSPGVDEDARVTGDGWGTVRVGATYEELARETGLPVLLTTLEDGPAEQAACTYVTLEGQDLVGMHGGDGRVGAVVFDDPGVVSRSGVGVGDTEQEVLAVYGDRAERRRNEYVSVEDVFVAAGPGRVVRFEFGEDRVVRTMHAGLEEYAALVEGCA